MATNTGKGTRKGAVKGRSQTQNPKTGQYVKRNAEDGKFMAAKNEPYKGVAQEPDGRRKKK